MFLDETARRYGTDPWTVLTWTESQISVAYACLQAARKNSRRRLRDVVKEHPFPVVVLHDGRI